MISLRSTFNDPSNLDGLERERERGGGGGGRGGGREGGREGGRVCVCKS